MAQKVITNSTIVSPNGQEINSGKTGPKGPRPQDAEGAAKWDEDLVPLTAAFALRDFCMAIWGTKFAGAYADSKACDRIIRACQKAKKTLELDEADYEWATKKLEEHGPGVYGWRLAVIRDALDLVEGTQEAPKAKEKPK